MNLQAVQISWFDLLVVVLLLVGVMRGRKRGMSQELLDVLQWLLIVVAAGFFYQPLGDFFASFTAFGLLSCYLWAYAIVAGIIMVTFMVVRRQVGEKLVTGDVFGNGEYYMGMMAGALRYLCILLVVLAFLNARHYSQQEIRAKLQYQTDNFGSAYFPNLNTLQQEVFAQSQLGSLARDYLSTLLIRPTSPEDKTLGKGGRVVKARERTFEQVLEKK